MLYASRMIVKRIATTLVAAAALVLAAPEASLGSSSTWVICAPGYPGNTQEAQANMDTFAAAVAKAAGFKAGTLGAVYHETESGGVERLARPDAALALVPLPFYLKHRDDLALAPRLAAVSKGQEASEKWSLVARKGAIRSAESLAGWEIHSLAAYAPGFVRGSALGSWGKLPADVTLVHTGQMLSSLRKASAGEKVALLLDASQTASMASLPFASQLEVVATSPALPSAVVCSVGARLPEKKLGPLLAALPKLGQKPDGAAALEAVRLSRFVPLDTAFLDAAVKAFQAGAASSK